MKRLATTTLAFVGRGPANHNHHRLLTSQSLLAPARTASSPPSTSSCAPLLSSITLVPTPSLQRLHTLPPDHPRPVVICGPSGVGKGTIIDKLFRKFSRDQFGFSVSHTTRQPRPGEVDGTHYNFTTVEQIKDDIADGKFVEYAEVHGNYYGTSLDAVQSVQNDGRICILDIDAQGVRSVKDCGVDLINPHYVFVAPPSMENLEQRLRGRGTEEEESIQRRLGNAREECDYGYGEGNFDMILVNDDLKVAVDELAATMKEWYPYLIEAKDE